MALKNKVFNLTATTRQTVRKELIDEFLTEDAGSGKGELASKYYYAVERFGEYSIELHRPAALNKGFDFTVHIIGMKFKKNRAYTNPSHNDIFCALEQVKSQDSDSYEKVKIEINNIFNLCQCDFDNVNGIKFNDFSGIARPVEIILLAVKWLFIEQDVTYWNWSGRQMFCDGLASRDLV